VALWLLARGPLVVAWRRYQHGLLIAAGATGPIAWASFARIAISVAVAAAALVATSGCGAARGAAALTAGAARGAIALAARAARPLPRPSARRAWRRGALIAPGRTPAVPWAMGASIVVLIPVLVAGVAFSSLDGVTIGAAALVVALVTELAVLTAFDGGLAR